MTEKQKVRHDLRIYEKILRAMAKENRKSAAIQEALANKIKTTLKPRRRK